MSITLKRVQTTATGAIHYRRKLPKDVREAIGQREFKRLIGHSQKEAVRNYAAADAECERLIEKARRKGGAGAAEATPLDHLKEARAELAALRRDQPDALSIDGRPTPGPTACCPSSRRTQPETTSASLK